jgi:hypothetical protein
MPFSNSVLGGVGKLIRSYIRSPNYVAGSTGWTINKDGSAEFSNVTMRGTLVITAGKAILLYNGTPAAGNLVASFAPNPGFDPFGNAYGQGIQFHDPINAGNLGTITYNNALITLQTDDGASHLASLQLLSNGAPSLIHLTADNIQLDNNPAGLCQLLLAGSTAKLSMGSGPAGKYYVEKRTLNGIGVTTGGVPKLITPGAQVAAESKFDGLGGGTAWSGSTWTAPDDGFYDFILYGGGMAVSGAANSWRWNDITKGLVFGNLGSNTVANDSGLGPTLIGLAHWMAAGDQANLQVFQNTGATVTFGADSYVNIARRPL